MKKLVFVFLFFIQDVFPYCNPKDTLQIRKLYSLSKKKTTYRSLLNNVAPILTATGNQIYCPQSQINIVTNFTIVDPDDTGIDAIYIQISSGYVSSQDILTLTGNHPNINASWDQSSGKLTLTGVTNQPTYIEIITAVEDVVFQNNTAK